MPLSLHPKRPHDENIADRVSDKETSEIFCYNAAAAFISKYSPSPPSLFNPLRAQMARLVIAAIEAKGLHSKQSLLQIVLRSYGASQDICSFLSFVRPLEVLLCPASSEESESKSRFVPPLHTFSLPPSLVLLITAGSGGGDRSGVGARPMARQSVHSALSLSLSPRQPIPSPPQKKNHSLSLFIPSPSFLPPSSLQ